MVEKESSRFKVRCVLPISVDPKYWDECGHKVKKAFKPNGDPLASQKANEIITEAVCMLLIVIGWNGS